jgi:beta-lactamase class A
MNVSDLIAAAIQYSDNTAANLLLNTVGGPASLTAYLRQIGDGVTRLDRIEPDLNSATPGDQRDTTTPGAMMADMRALLVEGHLEGASRDRLLGWLVGNTTGAAKLRAGLPSAWRVGDKTGTGDHGSTNDVAIVWPTGRRQLLVAAYLTETTASEAARNEALAQVGQQVARWVEGL